VWSKEHSGSDTIETNRPGWRSCFDPGPL
jgi:hypothetical protein